MLRQGLGLDGLALIQSTGLFLEYLGVECYFWGCPLFTELISISGVNYYFSGIKGIYLLSKQALMA